MRNDGMRPALACLKMVIGETDKRRASSSAVKARPACAIWSASERLRAPEDAAEAFLNAPTLPMLSMRLPILRRRISFGRRCRIAGSRVDRITQLRLSGESSCALHRRSHSNCSAAGRSVGGVPSGRKGCDEGNFAAASRGRNAAISVGSGKLR